MVMNTSIFSLEIFKLEVLHPFFQYAMQIKKGNRIVNINFSLNSKQNSKHKLTQSDQLVRCNYKNGFLATSKSVAISNIFRLVLNPTHLNCLVSTTGRLLLDSTKTYMSLFLGVSRQKNF